MTVKKYNILILYLIKKGIIMFITEAKTSEPFKQYRKQQVKSDIIVEYTNGVKQKF